MIAKCKEKNKSALGYIQICGYTMPHAFINSESTNCGSNLLMNMLVACNHNSTYHNKSNTCLVFSCFKVEIIRFVYIVVFLIYHGNI